MSLTTEQVSDLKLAVETLNCKASRLGNYWTYYDGAPPLRWSLDKLEDVFDTNDVNFRENWCYVVVNAVTDRLSLKALTVPDNEEKTADLLAVFEDTNMAVQTDDMHEDLVVSGESFIIAWEDVIEGEGEEESVTKVQLQHNYATNVAMFYESANPNNKRMAAKWWVDDTGHRRVTLYYPDRLEFYRSNVKDTTLGETTIANANVNAQTSEKIIAPATNIRGGFNVDQWTLFEEEGSVEGVLPNPFGIVPVFHFQLSKRSRSELADALAIQDVINKTLSDMMVTSEFAAFPQRWIISNMEGKGKLPYGPMSTLVITPSDSESQSASVGVFPAADLSNFLEVISSRAQTMAIISRTPKHYFWGQGGTPSGEALIAAEAPLNKKVKKYVKRLDPVYKELGRFILKLQGDSESVVKPIWDHVESITPVTQATIRELAVKANIPIDLQLEQEGTWTEDEIQRVKDHQATLDLKEAVKTGQPANPAQEQAQREQQIDKLSMAVTPKIEELIESIGNIVTDKLISTGAAQRAVTRAAKGNSNNG